jgi:hypothetical protein
VDRGVRNHIREFACVTIGVFIGTGVFMENIWYIQIKPTIEQIKGLIFKGVGRKGSCVGRV